MRNVQGDFGGTFRKIVFQFGRGRMLTQQTGYASGVCFEIESHEISSRKEEERKTDNVDWKTNVCDKS